MLKAMLTRLVDRRQSAKVMLPKQTVGVQAKLHVVLADAFCLAVEMKAIQEQLASIESQVPAEVLVHQTRLLVSATNEIAARLSDLGVKYPVDVTAVTSERRSARVPDQYLSILMDRVIEDHAELARELRTCAKAALIEGDQKTGDILRRYGSVVTVSEWILKSVRSSRNTYLIASGQQRHSQFAGEHLGASAIIH